MREYFATAIAALAAWSSSAVAQNVALGKPVTVTSGTTQGVDPSTLVDDAFLDRGTHWQEGTIWWNGLDPILQVDLGASYLIESLVAQVDDNDDYSVLYRVPGTTTWAVLWEVPNYNAFGSGMQTRPNPDDPRERYFLPTAVETDALRLIATNGDDSYSASELQAWIVPTPSSAALMLPAGLRLTRRSRVN